MLTFGNFEKEKRKNYTKEFVEINETHNNNNKNGIKKIELGVNK